MLRGSCLCDEVKYEIGGSLRDVRNCHCSMCRKAHGAAFRTRATVRAADFRYLKGEHLITAYESSPGTYRTFLQPLRLEADYDLCRPSRFLRLAARRPRR
jgi:hypothetical protein